MTISEQQYADALRRADNAERELSLVQEELQQVFNEKTGLENEILRLLCIIRADENERARMLVEADQVRIGLEFEIDVSNQLLTQAKDILWHAPGGHQALIDDIEVRLSGEPRPAPDEEEDTESPIEQLDEALCTLLYDGGEVGEHSPRTHLDLFYACRLEGDNALLARNAAGWAIAKARLERLEKAEALLKMTREELRHSHPYVHSEIDEYFRGRE